MIKNNLPQVRRRRRDFQYLIKVLDFHEYMAIKWSGLVMMSSGDGLRLHNQLILPFASYNMINFM